MIAKKIIPLKFFSAIIKLFITSVVVILYIHYFLPQNWPFYTAEPNIPLYNIYRVQNGIADKSPLIKNNMSYGMGISRKGKILLTELYSIIENNDLPWKLLNQDSLIIQHNNYIVLERAGENATFRGNFLITKTNRPSYLNLVSGELFLPAKRYILADIR